MQLIPDRYVCGVHNLDLSDKVRQRVENNPTLVASLSYQAARGKVDSVLPFAVILPCPGKGDGSHELEFKGTIAQ